MQRCAGEQALADGHLHQIARDQTCCLTLGQHLLLDQILLDRVVGNAAVPLVGQIDASVGAEAELHQIGLQLVAPPRQGEELFAQPVEERVGTDSQRIFDDDWPVLAGHTEGVDGVLELAPHTAGARLFVDRGQLVGAIVDEDIGWFDDAAVHGRPGDERLDGRADVVPTLHRAVHQDRLIGIVALREQLVELVFADAGVEPPIVERGVAGHGHDLTIAVVHDDHRPGRRLVLDPLLVTELLRAGVHPLFVVLLGVQRIVGRNVGRDLFVGRQIAALLQLGFQRLLGVLLQVEVDAELDVLPRHRLDRLEQPHGVAGGVDLPHLFAPLAVQLGLHAGFHTELTDAFVAVVAQQQVVLQRAGSDGTHVAHDVTGQRRERVHPVPLLGDIDAREVLAAL